MRNILSLNEHWKFVKSAPNADAAATGEIISLPHTWNAIDGQDGGNDYYRGTCWYVKEFAKPQMNPSDHVYLEFPGAAMTADVYVNNEKVTHHEGGYSAFRVDITQKLQEHNLLAVSLNNDDNLTVYPQKADFTFYGGLYRGVRMMIVPQTHFSLDYCGAPGIKVTPAVNLETQTAMVTVEAWVTGSASLVSFTVNGQTITSPLQNQYAKAVFTIENVHLWDGIKDPYLYTAAASLENGDQISTRFGCREFRIDPQNDFF